MPEEALVSFFTKGSERYPSLMAFSKFVSMLSLDEKLFLWGYQTMKQQLEKKVPAISKVRLRHSFVPQGDS